MDTSTWNTSQTIPSAKTALFLRGSLEPSINSFACMYSPVQGLCPPFIWFSCLLPQRTQLKEEQTEDWRGTSYLPSLLDPWNPCKSVGGQILRDLADTQWGNRSTKAWLFSKFPQWLIGSNSGKVVQTCPSWEVRPNSQTVNPQACFGLLLPCFSQ